MTRENRKNQRVPADIRTRLNKTSDVDRYFDIHITDLSAGGAGFKSRKELAVGESVEFQIPAGILIGVRARIASSVRVGSLFRHGSDFVEMDPAHYQVLASHVREQRIARRLSPLELDV